MVNASYLLRVGLLAPYKGVCYHSKEYPTCALSNARELFNYQHVSLRNVIERAFGILKKNDSQLFQEQQTLLLS